MKEPIDALNQFLNPDQTLTFTTLNYDNATRSQLSWETFQSTVLSLIFYFHTIQKLKPGDTIAYRFENCPEILAINFACFFTGLIACPLDVKRDQQEVIEKKLKETNAQLLLYQKGHSNTLSLDSIGIQAVAIENFESLQNLSTRKADRSFIQSTFSPEKTALILYTSGTTGFPKGAQLTFSNLFYGAKQVLEWFEIKNTDNFYVVLPLHHINSTIFCLATLLSQGSLTIPTRYSKSKFFQDCADNGCTMSSIVATINIDLLEEHDAFVQVQERLKLRRIQIGSAPVSAQHAQKFVEHYNIRLIQGYGSTETALRVTGVPPEASENLYEKLLSTNSIGQALSENEVRLVQSNGCEVTTEDTEGEITVKGKNIMKGYLGRKEDTEKALKDGYFHTGDLGCFKLIENTRFYYMKGRLKEIIIKGGVNISPIFIEEQLRKNLSWIRDVVVVGYPNFRFGEEIAALFIPKGKDFQKDFEEAQDALRNFHIENLSAYETPKVGLVVEDYEIAKTSTGKVQHTLVRDAFKTRLQKASQYISENASFYYQIISPDEDHLLKEAVQLHNNAFPKALSLTEELMYHRAVNGFVIGAFEKKTHDLVGILTGFFAPKVLLDTGTTFNAITGNGRFTTASIKGNTAIFSSAASKTSADKQEEPIIKPHAVKLTEKNIQEYIQTHKDYVVRFHFTPKVGFAKGASVYKILLNANPDDKESLGTIVMFEYPTLFSIEKLSMTLDKIGIGLVEAAIIHAKFHGKKYAVALSRLGEAYKYFH